LQGPPEDDEDDVLLVDEVLLVVEDDVLLVVEDDVLLVVEDALVDELLVEIDEDVDGEPVPAPPCPPEP
jgi:hypothetical protein